METPARTFAKQADRLYERGVGAAKGGQRQVAAGLLRQAVRLNPQHELAWLWLSGVLDDPEASAFCLRAALELNPENERARQGLAVVTERMAREQKPVRRLPPVSPLADPAPADPWWSTWRDAHRVWRSTVRLLWLIPSLLLAVTLVLRFLIQSQPLPGRAVTYHDLQRAAVAAGTTAVPTAIATVGPADPSLVTAYYVNIRALQGRLHESTDRYRSTTEQSNTDVERSGAAHVLRDSVARERSVLQSLVPPPGLEEAQATYLDGLQQEVQALDDLLSFYATYDAARANRAGLGLQDSRAKIDEAKHRWDAYAQQFNADPSPKKR